MTGARIVILQPPSPPFLEVMRDYAGGYGTAQRSSRPDYGHDGGAVPYLSVLHAAAVLRQAGFDLSIVDGQAERLTLSDTIDCIEDRSPKIVISALSLPSLRGDLDLLSAVRQRLPSVPIVGAGTVCKELYNEVLQQGSVAAVVRGDAEVVLPALVPAVLDGADLSNVRGIAYRQPDAGIRVTPPAEPLADLDSLPMPPYDVLPMERYWDGAWGTSVRYMMVVDSRGCPYQCASYCPYPFGFGKKPLHRDPRLVVDELEYLYTEFGTEGFIFRGQNFTLFREHAEGICSEILRRGLSLRWLCETRMDAVDRPLLDLMKKAGCERVHYGLESGDPELFNTVGKPGRKLADLGQIVAETKAAGMFVRVNVVVGLPGETWQTIRRTIRTVKRLKPDEVMAAIITPYPGTSVFEDAKRRGLLLSEDWSDYTGFDPVMRTEHLSAEDLMAAKTAVENSLWAVGITRRVLRKAFRVGKRVIKAISSPAVAAVG